MKEASRNSVWAVRSALKLLRARHSIISMHLSSVSPVLVRVVCLRSEYPCQLTTCHSTNSADVPTPVSSLRLHVTYHYSLLTQNTLSNSTRPTSRPSLSPTLTLSSRLPSVRCIAPTKKGRARSLYHLDQKINAARFFAALHLEPLACLIGRGRHLHEPPSLRILRV